MIVLFVATTVIENNRSVSVRVKLRLQQPHDYQIVPAIPVNTPLSPPPRPIEYESLINFHSTPPSLFIVNVKVNSTVYSPPVYQSILLRCTARTSTIPPPSQFNHRQQRVLSECEHDRQLSVCRGSALIGLVSLSNAWRQRQ